MAVAVLSALPLAAEQPVNVSFYECLRCSAPPVIDGKLDDGCWQSLPVMDQFFQYWTPVALPPALKTGARYCYDARGLYVGITMYEEQLDKIRATITSRDDPDMWKDDCVEIMVDPGAAARGYVKFTTNALGARYDEKTRNGVNDSGWNVENWQVRTSKGSEAWYIEAFLPWTDLECQPREGELWAFVLVRYGYSSGGFKGVTSAVGGSYGNVGRFGYLGFGPFTPYSSKALTRMASVMRRTKGEYFRIIQPEVVLTCRNKRWQRQGLGEWMQTALQPSADELIAATEALQILGAGEAKGRLETAAGEVARQLADLQAESQREDLRPGRAVLISEQALALQRQAAEVKWESKLLSLIGQ